MKLFQAEVYYINYFLHKLRSYGKIIWKSNEGTIGSKMLTHIQNYSLYLLYCLFSLDSYLNLRLLRV